MDIRNIVIISLVLLITGPAVAADAQLGRLVKDQQSNDNAAFKDRKIEQKDVFSDAVAKKETDSTFPLETPCFQIDELVLSNDFLD
ncbi:ShlB/FhaC/HecB family hemolysin secretion/activation protein, partial [Klebsiella aerogenes]|nr:ShlB/FhaC/HecB family hemolysin secretion/activation protein [Klebsiella aerogenes]